MKKEKSFIQSRDGEEISAPRKISRDLVNEKNQSGILDGDDLIPMFNATILY